MKRHTVTTTTLLGVSFGPRKKKSYERQRLRLHVLKKLAYSIKVKKEYKYSTMYIYFVYACNKKVRGIKESEHVMRSGDGASKALGWVPGGSGAKDVGRSGGFRR